MRKNWGPSRTDVKSVQCPKCSAKPGWSCWRKKDGRWIARKSNHIERVNRYQESMKVPATLTPEEIRLVSCPACGAGSTDKCWWPGATDRSALRKSERIHEPRRTKAVDYRAEHRI